MGLVVTGYPVSREGGWLEHEPIKAVPLDKIAVPLPLVFDRLEGLTDDELENHLFDVAHELGRRDRVRGSDILTIAAACAEAVPPGFDGKSQGER